MNIAFLSSYPPKACGVGQFCFDLIHGLQKNDPTINIEVYAIDDREGGYDYPSIVKDHFYFQNRSDYSRIATLVNGSSTDLCVIQHEFELFGGQNKEYLLDFINQVNLPIVVVMHSVPIDPAYETYPSHKKHMEDIANKVDHFITMSEAGRQGLVALGIDSKKISVIVHGAPSMPPLSRAPQLKQELDLTGVFTILQFGLLNKFKGTEYILDAVEKIYQKIKIKFLIIGTPLSQEHIDYINMLKNKSSYLQSLHVVRFIEEYFRDQQLYNYIVASDVVLTPYLSTNRISSGPLTFAVAAGTPVISTPYPFAKELLKDIGILVPYKDSDAIADAIFKLATDKKYYEMQRTKTFGLGKTLSWDLKAKEYLDLFTKLLAKI